MTTTQVLRQRKWTEAELQRSGFRYYLPTKRLVMARIVKDQESPKIIDRTKESLIAKTGDVICYNAGQEAKASVDDYDQWPVRLDLFKQNYKPWDDIRWKPTPAEAHLWKHGCKPFYKAAGVWAMRLGKPVYIQSLESPEPVLVEAGRWLCIGAKGEPYHMDNKKFTSHYIVK